MKIKNLNAKPSTIEVHFSHVFARIFNLSSDGIKLHYIEWSGEFLVDVRPLNQSEKENILETMSSSNFIAIVQEEISEIDKDAKVEKSSQPSVKPALSKLIH